MISVFLLAKTGNFFMDIIFPGLAGGIVLLLILNSVLDHWGYSLW